MALVCRKNTAYTNKFAILSAEVSPKMPEGILEQKMSIFKAIGMAYV